MSNRIFNFNPGPATLPESVLKQAQDEFMDYLGTGMSIVEISHRSKQFDDLVNRAVERVKRLLGLSDRYTVMFLQGGATMQFAQIPMNLCAGKTPAYLNTGTWSTKAIKDAQTLGLNPNVLASSEDRNFCYIPKDYTVPADAAYLHFTTNNTIKGTQFHSFPKCPDGVPLIADMSSDMLSRPFDASPFGFIYAGAQKNLGPAGVVLAIIRDDMLERVPDNLPLMLKYTTQASKNSMANTAPCFAIYMVELVLTWLEDTVGGLAKAEEMNQKKAKVVYDAIDNSGGFYKATADQPDRSLMNVTFRLAKEDLEPKFVEEGAANKLGGLKGHRSVGGCRASIYNAMPLAGVEALAQFMAEFAKKNG
jgi:phosphoserine aminotransferase